MGIMSDHHNDLSLFCKHFKMPEQDFFRNFIQFAEGLIQQDQVCIFIKSSCYGDPLLLTSADIPAIFRNYSMNAFGKSIYQIP